MTAMTICQLVFYITLIPYINCRKPKYALKAEDIIGNNAVSENDNTNQSQDDYGGDCVDGDCDRKSDGEDNSDGDTKRDEGCDAADVATVMLLRLPIIMLGLQLMI